MSKCIKCGATLTFNEKGIYKRLVNRESTQFMCKTCLAKELKVSTELLDKKIEHFKRMGCSLFI